MTHGIHIIYTNSIKRKNTQIYSMVEAYTLFNEQAVCKRGTKWKEYYLIKVGNIFVTLAFPNRVRDVSTLKRKEAKRITHFSTKIHLKYS